MSARVRSRRRGTRDNATAGGETMRPLEASPNEVHEPLKSRRGITKSERHVLKLKKALGCAESGLWSIFLLDLDLPVAAEEVSVLNHLEPASVSRVVLIQGKG